MDEGSTQETGDRNLSTSDAAEILIQRRQERAEAAPEQPAQTVEEPEERDTPEPEAAPEEPAQEVAESTDEPEEPDVELEAEPAEEAQDADDPTDADQDGDDGGEFKFETIDEIAQAAGMEIDDFLQLKAATVVDGETGSVTIGELLKGHQLESSFTRKNQAWIKEKAEAEAEIETQRAKLNDHFQLTTDIFQGAQQALVADFESINWQELQASNPDQYQQLRQQFGMRQARLNQTMKEATARLKQAAEQQEADEAQAEQKHLAREHEMLMSKVPEWSDSAKRDKDAAEIGKYLTSIGYTAGELEKMTDHRLILLARAAMGQSGPTKRELELAKKKIDKVPKGVKPGARNKPRDSGESGRITGLKQNLKKTGKTDAAAELLIARRQQRARNQRRRNSPA